MVSKALSSLGQLAGNLLNPTGQKPTLYRPYPYPSCLPADVLQGPQLAEPTGSQPP